MGGLLASTKMRFVRQFADFVSRKFCDGFMIHSGQPNVDFVDYAVRHVLLRQGVLGIKVKIMRPSDVEGKMGPAHSLPDAVTLIEPKPEAPVEIRSEHKDVPVAAAVAPAAPAAEAPVVAAE